MASIKKSTGKKVKRIQADSATQFLSMCAGLRNSGIVLTTSLFYSAESCGVAERIDKILMTIVSFVLKEGRMEKRFWVTHYSMSHFSIT